MSLARLRPESVAASAIAYASVTEQVALGVARLEGSGAPEKAYTLATEVLREELGKGGVSGRVEKLKEYGLDDPEKKLALDDLIRGEDVVFAATGITPGETLHRVRYFRGGVRTHTVVVSTEPHMVRFMDTIHALEPDAGIQGFQL